jgi:amino acid adenylation domain-containing protein
MSSGGFYSRLAALTAEQRAIFARRLASHGLADPDAEISPRPPGAGPVPASLVQQRLWLLDQMEPGNPFYNLPLLAFRLAGPLGCRERGAFAAACAELARRHEALRTTFRAVDGAPVQVVAPPPPAATLALADLSGLPAARRAAAARRLALEEARRPFDLAAGPLWRTRLLRLDAEDHLLLVAMHHIISDAWSIGVFYRELRALYAAARARRPSPLPELAVQYPDFALWQRRRLTGDLLEGEIAFWRAQLAGAPEQLALPTDRPRPRARTYRGRRRTLALPRDLPEALAGLAQAAGASLFMAVLAGMGALLHRLTGEDDLVLGSPVAGRGQAGTEGLIGFFVNTVVFRLRLAGEPSVRELLARVREVVLDVYEHQELPFDKLVEEIRPRRSTSYGPVFQAMFSLQNISTPDLALDGLAVTPEWLDNGTSQTDLILFGGAHGGRLGRLDVLQLEYNTDLFDDATIARMEGHLLCLLAAAAAEPATRLADLPLLSPPERHQLLEWSGALAPATPRVDDTDRCDRLDRRFAAQAALRPAAIAVELGGEALSYGELARRAARLAAELARRGVRPEVPVGLCLERTLDLPVAMLGALMAGGAYLPLDPESPPERLSFILADARAPVVVTTRRLASRLGETPARLVLLDEAHEPDAADAPDAPEAAAAGERPGTGPEALAYGIYTSGSTGRPKGVLVSHRAALRLFAATQELFGFGPGDVWTVFHSPAFDFAVWELWGALLHGGRAVLLPAAVTRSPEELLAILRERRATLLSQTPSAFRGLLAAMIADPASPRDLALRAIVFGGEALQPEDLRSWFTNAGTDDASARPVNMYGITETTVHATFRPITAADLERPGGPASPLGRPLADLGLHLLDRAGNPVPIGVAGEICIGGAGLARGYLGRPDTTAERFVPDPFSGCRGGRLYRSGDLARRWPDGDVEYLGRIDLQVKVRGVRIELGEIESALARHPAIAAAVVAARELAPGDVGLAAYCVPAAGGRLPEPAELRAFLRGILPEIMVPSAFVPLASLPLTVNGKLDRRALPAPERLRQAGEELLPPSTPLEETLAGVWRELLGVDRIGMRDDFFDLGGHSLLATRLASRLRDRLGVEVSAQLVFHTPTVAGMAGELERLIATGAREGPGALLPRAPALVPVARRARRSAG